MEGISAAAATNQAMTQQQLGMEVMKMAVQSQQQVATMLGQATQTGAALAANPAHLGQSLDTYA